MAATFKEILMLPPRVRAHRGPVSQPAVAGLIVVVLGMLCIGLTVAAWLDSKDGFVGAFAVVGTLIATIVGGLINALNTGGGQHQAAPEPPTPPKPDPQP
jgi:Ni,Fe-hydrogenase I cytochrome b subunit